MFSVMLLKSTDMLVAKMDEVMLWCMDEVVAETAMLFNLHTRKANFKGCYKLFRVRLF